MALVQAVENGKIKESTTETTTSAGNDLGYDEFLQLLCSIRIRWNRRAIPSMWHSWQLFHRWSPC